MVKKALQLCIVTLVALFPITAQNLILNGDFENLTSTGCHFNLTNDEFNTLVKDATAFSSSHATRGLGEIDVMNDPAGCFFGSPPPSGATKLGIATVPPGVGIVDSGSDAFSLHLSAPVSKGSTYTVSFDVGPLILIGTPDLASVEIGLSDASTSFGTLVFAGAGNPAVGFTRLTHGFFAPVDAAYLTVRNQEGPDSWNHVDNFSLTPTAGFAEPFGTGCPGSAGVPMLAAAPGSLPRINDTFTVQMTLLPTSALHQTFGIVGLSKTNWAGIALPQDLGFIGAPGCTQYVSIDASVLLWQDAGVNTWDIPIPNDQSLKGLVFFLQGVVVDFEPLTNNPPGLVHFSVTNALESAIG